MQDAEHKNETIWEYYKGSVFFVQYISGSAVYVS